jgi:hypothetical protein
MADDIEYRKIVETLNSTLETGSVGNVALFLQMLLSAGCGDTPFLTSDTIFSLFDTATTSMGREFMKKVICFEKNILKYYGFTSIIIFTPGVEYDLFCLFVRYASSLGLQKKIWLAGDNPQFHDLCGLLVDDLFHDFPIDTIPDDLINELLVTRNAQGHTPLHCCSNPIYLFKSTRAHCMLRYAKLFRYLSSYSNFTVAITMVDNEGDTPLHYAFYSEIDCGSIDVLLDTDECKSTIRTKNNSDIDPFMLALNYGRSRYKREEHNALFRRFVEIDSKFKLTNPALESSKRIT